MSAIARFDIAITDKNPHVREFLCRELAELGFGAHAMADAGELLRLLSGPTPPRMLVLDPEAAGARLDEVARWFKRCAGKMVVVLHMFEGAEPPPGFEGALVVEKEPHIGSLKAAVNALATQAGQVQAPDKAGACGTQEKA